MRLKKITTLLLFTTLFGTSSLKAASPEKEAKAKLQQLNELIEVANNKKIDTKREECAVWMAGEFLMYADWDEKNTNQNEYQYTTWKPFAEDAKRLAKELPNFERTEVVKMLDTAIEELSGVIDGKYKRRDVPEIDWSNIKPKGNQFVSNNRPTFINSYFTIPEHQCNEFVGIPRGTSLALNAIQGENGGISYMANQTIVNKETPYSGYVLLWHGQAPQWISAQEPDVAVGKRLFTHYDIDNPLIRQAWDTTFRELAPIIKEKRSADMGYILANEPHWHSIKGVWATGEISKYTLAKFRYWLAKHHKDIAALNKLWGTNFASFDQVNIEVPILRSEATTPKGYDWQRFNMDRVTEWFYFLDGSLKKYDPTAKTHIKLIPRQFGHEYHDHGLDFEALFELQDIVGNDAKVIKHEYYKSQPSPWEKRYAFDWQCMAISYDFFHSVNPYGPNVNSESHFLSSTAYRDIYMTKEFTRSAYWMATMHGMNASFSWFWAREKDGEIRKDLQAHKDQFDNAMNSAYVASVVQQPRVANEVTKTYMELNAFGNEIAKMQSLPRPIRIFYSETSVLNKRWHVQKLTNMYDQLYFEGMPLGFATERIINKQYNGNWEVIVIGETEYVTKSELAALQSYLDFGGTIVMDKKSLKFDEYKRPHTTTLTPSNGKLIVVNNPNEYQAKTLAALDPSFLPAVAVDEQNSLGLDGCAWRVVKGDNGNYIMSICNTGKTDATITLSMRNGSTIGSITEQFLGQPLQNGFTIPSEVTMLIEIATK